MPKRDDAAGELEHGKVVLSLALPAHEQASVSVVPTVRALDDPASWLAVNASEQGLLAASADVRCDSAHPNGGSGIDVVVSLVEAQVLRTTRTTRPTQHDRVEHLRHEPLVVYVRRSDQHREGNAALIGEHMSFYPEFPAVRRVPPCVAPPFGALAMALSSEAKSHLMPRRLS
jgi:hypothetical protein